MIPILEKDQSNEKVVEERLRREIKEQIKQEIKQEIKEEIKEKKGGSRKTAGLIISGVGGLLYLINGLIFLLIGYTYYAWLVIAFLIAGGIVITGTIIGLTKVKAGGGVILSAIPSAIIIGIIIMVLTSSYYYYSFMVIQYLLLPYPFPHAIHVIPGAILCLTAVDKKVNEY